MMSKVLRWVALALLAVALAELAVLTHHWILAYNINVEKERTARMAHGRDVQLCRIYLGYEGDTFSQRALMMGCANEVVERDLGNKVPPRQAYDHAWRACMPLQAHQLGGDACERALR